MSDECRVMNDERCIRRTPILLVAKLVNSSFITPHFSPFPLDLAEFSAFIPLGRGGYFVSAGGFHPARWWLTIVMCSAKSGILVPLDGYPTSHNSGRLRWLFEY